MVEVSDLDLIRSKRKAITALFPYAVWRERDGKHEMFDALLRITKASDIRDYIWYHVEPLVSALLREGTSGSLKLAMVLASPHFPWRQFKNGENLARLWTAAVPTLSYTKKYTDEINRSVVDTLLHIASQDTLRGYISVDMWPSWLNARPSLPPVCAGRYWGSSRDLVQTIRGLKNADTLTSYLILVWSEWDDFRDGGLEEMRTSIQEDLRGTMMGPNRKELLQRLDHVLGQLDLGLGHLRQHDRDIDEDAVQLRKRQYGGLKKELQKVEDK